MHQSNRYLVHLRCGWNLMLLGLVVGTLSDKENCPHMQVCFLRPWIGWNYSFGVSPCAQEKATTWKTKSTEATALIISFVMTPVLRFWPVQLYYWIYCHSSQPARVIEQSFFLAIVKNHTAYYNDNKTAMLRRVLNKIANLKAQDKGVHAQTLHLKHISKNI